MTEATRLRQAPAAGEDAADQRVVDAELAALAVDALLGRAGVAVDLAGIAGVGVHEDELADVVQQRGDHQAVAVLVAGLGGEAVGGALRGDAVQAEALGRGVPARTSARRSRRCAARAASAWTASGESSSTASTTDSTRPRVRALDLVGEAQDGDDERDVGLDGGDDVAGRDALGRDQAQQAVARLGERRERLERLEGGRQAAAVALVVAALGAGGLGGGGSNGLDVGGRRGHSDRVRAFACVLGSADPPSIGRCGRVVEARARSTCAPASFSGPQSGVDARQRLVAAEHREGLEDARRDRGAGERDAHRLEDVLGLGAARLDHAAQRLLDVLGVERLDAPRAPRGRRPARSRPPSASHFSRAAGSSAGPSKMKPASGQKSASVWIFSCGDRDRVAQAGAAGERLQARA